MKRVIALLLCLIMTVCCIASCGEDTPEEVHTHTYSETWSSDAVGHWYMATCECEDVVETKLAHADKNNDGACDVCEYKTACAEGHTYSDDWTVDCTNHWHAADCGHIVAGANIAAHDDDDEDGECDVCGYVINDIHTHYYDIAWTTDEQYHWHAALCEHGVEVADKAAHVLNAAGYCTVCDAKVQQIDLTDIEAVLAAAIARNDKIIDGNVTAAQLVYGGSGDAMYVETGMTNEVFYVLGKTDSYIFYKSFDVYGDYIGGDHQYHEKISDDEYVCVQMEAGSYELKVVDSDAQFLNGYTYFPGSILPSDSDDTSTLANTLSAIYALAKAGKNVDNFTESYDAETGKYEFAFRYFTVNSTVMSDDSVQHQVELYGVAAEFYVDDNGVISLAEFAVSSYRNWELDNDLDYDAATNTVTLRDSANPTIYAYSVSQRSGERTYTTPYPKASLVPVDFELSYVTGTDYDNGGKMYVASEELITDTNDDGVIDLTLTKDEYVRLHLSSLVPYTAMASALNIDDFSMTFVNKDETKAGILWKDQDFLRPTFSSYMDCIAFKVADAGEYTVTIKFGDITKVLDITVPGEQPIVVPEDTATTKYVQTTDTYGWIDEYTYTATESGTYTFTIPEGLGIWLETSSQPEIDYYSANGGTVSFDLAAGKSIKFAVASTTKGLWEIGVSFVAGEVDDGDEGGEGGGESGSIAADISGTYYSGDNVLVINNDGTMTFTMGATVLNYTYAIDGDVVTYTLNGNAPYTADNGMAIYFGYLTFGTDGMPATFEYNNNSYALSTTASGGGDVGGGDDEGDTFPGSGTDADPYVLPSVGDYNCAFPGGYSPIWYTLTIAEGGYVTLSTTFTGSPWLMLGTGPMSYTSNEGVGNSMKAYFPANTVVYLAVGNYEDAAAEVPFNVSFEAKTSDPLDNVVGNWTATSSTAWGGGVTYNLTINADGTGAFSYDEGYGVTEATLDYVLVDGENVIIGYSSEWSSGSLNCTYVGGVFACAQGIYYESFEFTAGGSGVGGGEEQTPVYDTTIVAGENTLWFSEAEVTADTATRPLTITEAGNYQFNAGSLFISAVTDASGNPVTKNDDYTYTLVAGEYTVTFGMLSMFGVSADTAQTLNVINNSATGGEEGDGEGDGEGGSGSTGNPDGTVNNPYVVDELPYTVNASGNHDMYYTYTATEETTIEVSYVNGGMVTFTIDGEYPNSTNTGTAYVVTVPAGKTIVINPWTLSTEAVDYTYVISVQEPAQGGGDSEGGETASVVTYMSERHVNGRYIKVEIDTATGIATLTRSNMSGGWDANTATTTCTVTAGEQVTAADTTVKVTFDANGAPSDITWGSAGGYTNFTVQA